MQCEMELDGLSDIQFFALHPGGVPTAMAKRKPRSELEVKIVLLIRR
jgi:hypothetical protein